MIPYIKWPDRWFDEPYSPFLRGKVERLLRITFHSSSFAGSPEEEAQAIDLLRELSTLPEIEAIDTQAGPLPHLEIGEHDSKATSIPLTVISKDQRSDYSIEYYEELLYLAVDISNQGLVNSPATLAALQDVLLVQAHHRLRQDILITLSPRLLEHRSMLERANIRTPLEAAKIVGLFLRSRDIYTCMALPKFKYNLSNGDFYWLLTRCRIRGALRYLAVGERSPETDPIKGLGQSILMRCQWALEARDAIGKHFYGLHNNNTRDAIMYHFYYLTLLLVGAFDAQAHIAWRVYGIADPPEEYSGFQKYNSRKSLNIYGATDLYNLVSGQDFQDLKPLLYKLRDTIHSTVWPMMAHGDEKTYVIVLREYEKEMWEAAKRLGSPERWGMIQEHWLKFEPYTYAVTLVEECFSQINKIATATDITRLFHTGYTLPTLKDIAGKNSLFDESIERRLAILG